MNPPLPARAALMGTVGTGVTIQVLTLVTGILTARLLGPEGRGLLAGAILWPSLFAGLAALGTHQALSLRAAGSSAQRKALAGRAVALGLLLGLAGIGAGWIVLPLVVPEEEEDMLALGRLFLLFIPLNVLVSQLQALDLGTRNLRRLNVTRLVLAPAHLLGVCLLWALARAEALYFVAVQLIANAVTLAWRCSGESGSSLRPRFDVPWMRELIRDSRHFFLTSTGYLLQSQVDRIFLLWMLPVDGLGVYVVAAACAGVHLTVTRSLGLVVFSRAVGMAPVAALEDFARVFRHAVVVASMLSLVVASLLPFVVPVLFGADFESAVLAAVILVLGNLFGSLASLADDALRAQAKPLQGLLGRLLGSGAFVIVALALHDELGIAGVASAAAAGHAVFLAWMIGRIRKLAAIHLLPGRSELARVGLEAVGLLRARTVSDRFSA